MDGPLYLALEAAAVAIVLTRGSLFSVFREHGPAGWRAFARCALCVGFWCGASFSVVTLYSAWSAAGMSPGRPQWLELGLRVVGLGALSGAVALLYTVVVDGIDSAAAHYERQTPAAELAVAERNTQ